MGTLFGGTSSPVDVAPFLGGASGGLTDQLKRIKDLRMLKMISEQLCGSKTIGRPYSIGMGAAHHRFPYARRAIPRPQAKTPTRRNAEGRQVRCPASKAL